MEQGALHSQRTALHGHTVTVMRQIHVHTSPTHSPTLRRGVHNTFFPLANDCTSTTKNPVTSGARPQCLPYHRLLCINCGVLQCPHPREEGKR